MKKRYSEKEEDFWRKMILPEEDRDGVKWKGGYRWFRSPNVVPIEHWYRVAVDEEGRPAAA
jgi:hypothetical protein